MASDFQTTHSQNNAVEIKNGIIYEFENFRLDSSLLMLYQGGQIVPLAPKVVETLLALIEQRGEIIPKSEMMNRLWGGSFVEDANLTQNIYLLRKTLGKGADGRDLIETFRRRGYRFTGKIKCLAAKADETDVPPTSFSILDETIPATATSPALSYGNTDRLTKRLRTIAVFIVALAIVGLIFLLNRYFDARHSLDIALRVTPLTSSPAPERNPALSPDGKQIAYTWVSEKDFNFDIYVKITDAGTPLRLTSDPARDMSPAWSPDSRFIAFLRGTGNDKGFYVVPALGGPERKLAGAFGWNGIGVIPQAVDWSPDGKTLAVVDKTSENEPWSIFLISVETGEKHKITEPPAKTNGDVRVSFSPDGKTLAFVRTNSLTGNLFLMPIGGEPSQITFDKETIFYGLDWTSDGKRLVFSAGDTGRSTLWTIPAHGGERAIIPGTAGNVAELSVSTQNNRLAYAQSSQDINIWRMEIKNTAQNERQGEPPTKFISSTRIEDKPQFSPDGRKLVFKSNRSGSDEIWTCDREGQNPLQLTNLKGAYADNPRFSPDGRLIAFDVQSEGNTDIYIINAEGGNPRRLTTDETEETMPGWSHDSRFIYFASNRTGRLEIWKMPVASGEAMQITPNGGFASSESPDGQTLYYSKERGGVLSLWRINVAGGEEQPVVGQKALQWTVSKSGIYFFSQEERAKFKIKYAAQFYAFATGETTLLTMIEEQNPSFQLRAMTVSLDERWIVYGQRDHLDYDLMLVENFR